jgi:acyl carrier protein
MPESLKDRVREIVSSVFNVPIEQVTLTTSHDTVKNWDSANIISLLLALESEFGITLNVDEATNLLSVQAILDILHKKGVK